MKGRKQKGFDITKELKVSAPDSVLYEEVKVKLEKLGENPNDPKLQEELKRMEGILWERFRQLKNWEQQIRKKNIEDNELYKILARKEECVAKINTIREALGKEKIGESELARLMWVLWSR